MKREDLQAFAPMEEATYCALMAAARSVKEEPPMKRKISLGLVLAMVFIIMAVAALATTLLWETYIPSAKQTEQEQGAYAAWPIDEKIALIRVLAEGGYMETSDESDRLLGGTLTEAEAHAAADNLMLTLTGESHIRGINLDVITYAIMGFFETWTPEQRVWWQGITDQYRQGDALSPDTLVNPSAGDLTEKEAAAIAKEAILSAYEMEADALDGHVRIVADLYTTAQRPDYKRWSITFQLLREGSADYVESMYTAIVGPDGQVIADPDIEMPHVEDMASTHKALADQKAQRDTMPVFIALSDFYAAYAPENQVFYSLSLEAKAYFSAHVRPLILKIVADDPKSEHIPYLPLPFTTYIYGLPGPTHLPEEEALSLAKAAIMERRPMAEDVLSLYGIHTYFDITNPEKPLWKFYFNAYGPPFYQVQDTLPDDAWERGFKVELDATDGTITDFIIDGKVASPDDNLMIFL